MIRARLAGSPRRRAFSYKHAGDLATIGKRRAIIDFGWIQLRGTLAWWLWGLAHIYFLIGAAQPAQRRAQLAMDLRPRPAQRPADHLAGRRRATAPFSRGEKR